MTKAGCFNDAPILTPADDCFGIDRFAQALAKSFKDIESPIGTTIAINGAWGSGKSSAVNLVRYHLEEDFKNEKLELIDFRCWWFRGEEALTLAFLQELNASLRKSLGKKVKELIPRIGKTLLQAGPVVGPAVNLATGGIWGSLTSGSINFAKRFFSETENIEKLFGQLSKALENQTKRFLVLIDDIDRLTPDEALLIFRLIKSVGRLPNVMYLLVFDRELAEKAVTEKYPSEGPHFLEKIIQASFELPLPARDDLNGAALSQIEALCGSPESKDQLRRFMNIFYDAISPYLNTPRDLTRLSNAISVSWPAVAQEVNLGDYVALEVMRLFEPPLYNAIRTNKKHICGLSSKYDSLQEDPKHNIEEFLKLVPKKRHDYARNSIMRLFPRLNNTSYSHEFIQIWEAQRLVCTDKHFDTYFRMGIGDETLSIYEVDDFITRAGDAKYVKETFLKALSSIRKNGKSKVPLLFDEINVHAAKIDKANFKILISAIFEIADDLLRDKDRDRGSLSIGDNHLRIHWLIRKLTFGRCTLKERSDIFLAACKNAQVGWLVDFTSSAIADHFPHKDGQPEPPEKCLIAKEHVSSLKSDTIEAIKSSTANGSLILHPQLPYILFRWLEFSEDDGAKVKQWTSAQLEIDKSVSMLAKAFTGESWSHGMGMFGLGDRVSMRTTRASVEGLENILDIDEFRRRLEEIEKSETLDKELKDDVRIFLETWRKQENENDYPRIQKQ